MQRGFEPAGMPLSSAHLSSAGAEGHPSLAMAASLPLSDASALSACDANLLLRGHALAAAPRGVAPPSPPPYAYADPPRTRSSFAASTARPSLDSPPPSSEGAAPGPAPQPPARPSGDYVVLDDHGKRQIQKLHEELHLMQSRLNMLMDSHTLGTATGSAEIAGVEEAPAEET